MPRRNNSNHASLEKQQRETRKLIKKLSKELIKPNVNSTQKGRK